MGTIHLWIQAYGDKVINLNGRSSIKNSILMGGLMNYGQASIWHIFILRQGKEKARFYLQKHGDDFCKRAMKWRWIFCYGPRWKILDEYGRGPYLP